MQRKLLSGDGPMRGEIKSHKSNIIQKVPHNFIHILSLTISKNNILPDENI